MGFAIPGKNSRDKSSRKLRNEDTDTVTPEEKLEYSYQTIRDELAQELLKQVKSCSPAFFERLVI